MASPKRKVIAPSTRLAKSGLVVPERYGKNVGPQYRYVADENGKVRRVLKDDPRAEEQARAVADAGDNAAARMSLAMDEYNAAVAAGESANTPIKPLDEMAELVRTVADTAAREPDTVTANVAAALLALPVEDRTTVLRRAGRPALFEPLLEGDLPEPLRGGLDGDDGMAKLKESIQTEDMEAAQAASRGEMPAWKKPSSWFVSPDKISPRTGEIIPSSQTYKNVLPRDSATPLDVAAARGNAPIHGVRIVPESKPLPGTGVKGVPARYPTVESAPRGGSGGLTEADIAVFGMTEAAASTQKQAANRLAGDQIAQVKAIEKNYGEDSATLPQVVGKRTAARETDLTVGASQGWNAQWSGREPDEIGDVVAQRNRGATPKLLETLYRLTTPTTEQAGRGTGAIMRTVSPSDTTIDMDALLPWWRARIATMDAKGRYYYPSRLPSSEWVTGVIQGFLKVDDPEFFARVQPLIQRSIESASFTPSTEKAQRLSQKVYLLSPQMETAMRAGVGSPDYPYPVYGDTRVPRERVKKPERTIKTEPLSQSAMDAKAATRALLDDDTPAPASPPVSDSMQQARDKVKALMEKPKKRGPETTDTSSIYMLPNTSPIQGLLA